MCLAIAHAASPAKIWQFDQTIDKHGHVIVRIAPNAIRLDKPASELSLLCAAPDWKVYLFNEKRKIVCVRTFDDWWQHGLYMTVFDSISDDVGAGKYVINEQDKLLFKGLPVVRGTIVSHQHRQLKAQFMMASGIMLEQHEAKFLARLFDLDLPRGIVLSWMSHKDKQVFMQSDEANPSRGWVHEITTNTASQIPFVAKDFAPPTTFKPVKNGEVVVGNNGNSISDFLQ